MSKPRVFVPVSERPPKRKRFQNDLNLRGKYDREGTNTTKGKKIHRGYRKEKREVQL